MAISIIKVGGDGYNHGKQHIEFQIDSATDLTSLPTCAPGSRAILTNKSASYCLSNTGEWTLESFSFDWGEI